MPSGTPLKPDLTFLKNKYVLIILEQLLLVRQPLKTVKIRGRAFRTQIGRSTFFVLTILCLGGYGKHGRAFRTHLSKV